MKLFLYKASSFSFGLKKRRKILLFYPALFIVFFFVCGSDISRAGTLPEHLKKLTAALTSRNLDSLKILIDPGRIYVEIAPSEGAYLSPSQTLGVVESFFRLHLPLSFSYLLVKEEGNTGVAIGTLLVAESGRKSSHKVNFGFQKDRGNKWLLAKIIIK